MELDRHSAWLQKVEDAYSVYSPPPEAIGMTTKYELCFLETYAREAFLGRGRIVDLGVWFGATTAALARGLQNNQVATANKRVEAYDLFVWEESWMSRHTHRLATLEKSFSDGDRFVDDVRLLLVPYGEFVVVEEQDLLSPTHVEEAPVEVLFIDAQKSWRLGQAIFERFFPALIPETAYVIQQDFVYHDPSTTSVQMQMWYLRDHFEFVHHVPKSCSSVFRYTKPFDPDQPLVLAADAFDEGMIDDAYEWALACSSTERHDYLRTAKFFFLLERGLLEAAVRQARCLLHPTYGLASDLRASIRGLLPRYQRRHLPAASGAAAMDAAAMYEEMEQLVVAAET